jgi:hypothetical protein
MKTPPQPESSEVTSTTELYHSLVEAAKAKEPRGEKTRIFREFVEDLAEETGEPNILFSAALHLLQKKYPKMHIARSHFSTVMEKTYNVYQDKQKLIWVDTSKKKTGDTRGLSTVKAN